jgi:hypothetical protein
MGCHVKTPNTPIIAPTVVYQNRIPKRSIQPTSGRKYGKVIKPIRPNRNPILLPMAMRVINEGLPNISASFHQELQQTGD